MKYRTAWYREQAQRRAMMISKPAARKRQQPALPQTWEHLEGISIRLKKVVQDLFEGMRPSGAEGHPPEFSISLIADLEELPEAIEAAPARQKPVSPRGRHKIVAGGRVEAHAVIARVEVVARAVVYGLPGEEPPDGMTRFTWFLPLESDEK